MSRRTILRIFSTVLALILLCPVFAACGNPVPETDVPAPGPDAASAGETDAAAETEITRENLPDTLPSDLDFGGKSFTIYYSNGFNWTAFIEGGEELTGETVSDTVILSNESVSNRLNIDLEYYAENSGDWSTITSLVSNLIMANDSSYDVYLGEVLLFAAGKNITAKDKNDIPYISCLDDATMSVMTKLTERISSAKSVSMSGDQIITTAYPDNVYYFANGQALFAPEVLVHIESMRDVDIDIGIIPPPKYTADQNGYFCYADGWCVNVVLIPKSNPEPDDIGFILEAMSADSMNNLTPAYYDVCLTNKFVRDKESVEMLDLIFANVVMDNANIFSWGSLESTMNSAFANGDIASSIQSVKSATESAITKTVEAFQKNSK